MSEKTIRVHFVCMGNICRSPLAEGVFRHLAGQRGVAERFEVSSSGTGGWHVGEGADRRMRATAQRHGVSLDGHAAQQFQAEHLAQFDHIFAMDRDNLHDVLYYDRSDEHNGKVRLFREFDPEPGTYQVPDPYYGGDRGFEDVYEIVERTSAVILDRLIETYDLQE